MEKAELPKTYRKCMACGNPGMEAERAVLGGGWGGSGVRHVYRCPQCKATFAIENGRTRITSAFAGLLLMGCGAALLLAVPTLGGLVVGLLGLLLGGWGIVSGFLLVELRHSVTGEREGTPRTVPVEESLAETPEEKAREAKTNRRAAFVIWSIIGLAAAFMVFDLIWGAG